MAALNCCVNACERDRLFSRAALRALPPDASPWPIYAGAGEGNRTLVVSLEGFCSTIELHPLAKLGRDADAGSARQPASNGTSRAGDD